MVDTIFRFTDDGDTISSIADTEKIEFNQGTVPDATGRTVSTKFKMTRDINIHPNPRRKLDQIQDSLLGILDVWITGHFVTRDTSKGPINLYNWMAEDATSVLPNKDFPFGRFGLVVDNYSNGLLNETPTATLGYIIYDIEVEDVENPRDKMPFVAKFYLNGTPLNKPLT